MMCMLKTAVLPRRHLAMCSVTTQGLCTVFCLLRVANPWDTLAEGHAPAQLLPPWPTAESQLEQREIQGSVGNKGNPT